MSTIADLLETNDVCEEVPTPAEDPAELESSVCRNPLAISKDWETITTDIPFLNERTAEYQVAMEEYVADDGSFTPITDHSSVQLQSRKTSLQKRGLNLFIEYYGKDVSEGGDKYQELLGDVSLKDFAVPMRSSPEIILPTRVLMAIPAEILDSADEAPMSQMTSEEEEDASSKVIVTINIYDLKRKLNRLHNGLRIYSKFQSLSNAFQFRVFKKGTYELVRIADYKKYVKKIFPSLKDLAEAQGDYVVKRQRIFSGDRNLTEVQFVFTNALELETIYFHGHGCEEKIKATKKVSKFFEDTYLGDPIVSGFLAKINDIDYDLSAREPIQWFDFTKKYFNTDLDFLEGSQAQLEQSTQSSFINSIFSDSLMWDSILNQGVSIPDSIAHKYSDYIGSARDDIVNRKKMDFSQIRGQINAANLIEEFSFDGPFLGNLAGLLDDNVDPREILDRLGASGLKILLLKMVEGLALQLSFDDLLEVSISAALKNMSICDLGKLYNKIPVDIQSQIRNTVVSNLTAEGYNLSEYACGSQIWPWDEDFACNIDNLKSMESPIPKVRDTLTSEVQCQVAGAETYIDSLQAQVLDSATIIYEFIDALKQAITYEDILEYLNTFPGAEIIARILEEADFATPSVFPIDAPNFMKLKDLPYIRSINPITLPSMPQLTFVPPRLAISNFLKTLAINAMKTLFRKLIIIMLVKLSAYAKTVGSAPKSLWPANPAALKNAINNSDAATVTTSPDDDVNISEVFNVIGIADSGENGAVLINNWSSVLSMQEIHDLLVGKASDEAIDIAYKIVKYNNESFLSDLSDREKVRKFFLNMANYISQKELDKLSEMAKNSLGSAEGASGLGQDEDNFYAGASVCADSNISDDINNLRHDLLSQRGLDDSDIQEQLDSINSRTRQNIEEILDIVQGDGVEAIITQCFPSLVTIGDPTCPTTQGVLPKDDPSSVESVTGKIQDMLSGISDDFEDELIGNRGFFDYVLSDNRGNLLNNSKRLLRNILTLFVPDFLLDDPYPGTIGGTVTTGLRGELGTLAENITFDSTVGQNSFAANPLSYSTKGYGFSIKYVHSNSSNPETDQYSVETLEELDYNESTRAESPQE